MWSLIGVAVFCAAAMGILTWGFYGRFARVGWTVSLLLFLVAAVCVVLTRLVKRSLEKGEIGLDRSQLDPLTVARFMVIGKASAWTGAIVGGGYVGIATYVVAHASQLTAAADDTPGVIAAVVGSLAMSVAGVVLERNCETPPPTDNEAVS